MALIEIKNKKTNEIFVVPQSSYDSYIRDTGLYVIVEKQKEIDIKPKETVKQTTVKPKKPSENKQKE